MRTTAAPDAHTEPDLPFVVLENRRRDAVREDRSPRVTVVDTPSRRRVNPVALLIQIAPRRSS
jgi:hypothetical protein